MKQVLIAAVTFSAVGTWLFWPATEELEPQKFAGKLASAKNPLLVDLRNETEFAEAHIPGALNVPYGSPTFRWRIDELDTASPVFLYCAAGVRSAKALAYVEPKAFASVTVLKGGFDAWKQDRMEQTPPELVAPAALTETDYCRLLDLEHLVIVYFYVPWDKDCRRMGAVIDELAIAWKGEVRLLRINTDTYKYLATELGIDREPVLRFYENGHFVAAIEGPADRSAIEKRFALKDYVRSLSSN